MKLKYTFEIMDMDDQYVAVPVGEDADAFRGIVRLNNIALEMFKLLKEEITEADIVQKLLTTYDASEETIIKSVHEFIEGMSAEGLLE